MCDVEYIFVFVDRRCKLFYPNQFVDADLSTVLVSRQVFLQPVEALMVAVQGQ